VVGTEVFNFEK